MKIYIDGDACPVKEIIIKEAGVQRLDVVIVTSFSHYSHQTLDEYVQIIYVDDGADAADYKIVGMMQENDVLITQDYGLASLVLSKNCRVLHHLGFEYTKENIQTMLHSRHVSSVMRKSGLKTKGPKKLTLRDKQAFSQKLREVISEEKKV